MSEHRAALGRLRDLKPGDDSPIAAAARWYLRAVQNGVTPDSVVFFWIALEALTKPVYGIKLSKTQKRLSDVDWVEQGLEETGLDPTMGRPECRSSGRPKLRAEIVHGGKESPALLRNGYYTLEMLVRCCFDLASTSDRPDGPSHLDAPACEDL